MCFAGKAAASTPIHKHKSLNPVFCPSAEVVQGMEGKVQTQLVLGKSYNLLGVSPRSEVQKTWLGMAL